MKNRILSGFLRFFKKIMEDDIYALSSQLAYNLILSFFPFIIFIMTVIGYLHLNSEEVLTLLKNIMPLPAYELVQSTVLEVVNSQQAGLLWGSILLTLWVSSSGFGAVIRGLNKAYGIEEKRSFIKVKLISIISVLILAIVIVITLFLFVFGEYIKNFIIINTSYSGAFMLILGIGKNIILTLFLIIAFTVMYELIPCKRIGWYNAVPGAAFTTLGWILSSYAFAYYVNNFSNYSRLYGSLGAVFIFMTWIFLTSFILILGGEVNVILLDKENKEFK
ncbi:YihY/virulence factor BrkB family protein [Clostridium massiliamazoniense]|uniref:YihY/virulence factor BrkB family protein n=1 Tax=Clostridium massiliamazoniense TaxID=1347366 RepID=UPI0006D7645B|nr:YihY/virulence factor BrkB family protein [Clostridium massiliamazoniense]